MRTLILSLLIALTFSATAGTALAADASFFGPIVPEECSSCPCGMAAVMEAVRNVVNFIISIAIVIMMLMLVWGGILYMTTSANPENKSKAHSLLMNAVIGIVIVLAAWLVIDFVMRVLYSGDDGTEGKFGPWNSILNEGGSYCIVAKPGSSLFDNLDFTNVPQADPDAGGGPSNPNPGVGDPVSGTSGCPNCVSLSAMGISCKTSSSCTLDPAVAARVADLAVNFAGEWTVTEAYPPTYNHSNSCHRKGTCIDAGFRGSTGYTAENIAAFAAAARKASLRPVFETQSCSLRNAARAAGVSAYCSSDRGYAHITGNHFSLYAY